jgi:hypothetical protein
MKQTIAQTITDEMTGQGYKLIGKTSGWLSFRKNSNLSQKLALMGLTENDVVVRAGARVGQFRNDGYELLIFAKA